MIARSLLRTAADAVALWTVRFYFELSYRLLAAPAGRRFLRLAAAPTAPAVHGYSTTDDLQALVAILDPSPDDVLVDLGCGLGEVAIAIHRQTGSRVVGVDAAPRAVAHARRRAARAGVGAFVRFEVADLTSPPVRGSAAYALDSLMFLRSPPQALALASRSLEPPGRVFATFVDHRGLDRDAFARFIEGEWLRLDALDDVTAQFRRRNRERATLANQLLRARLGWSDRLALRLVAVEEALVMRLIERGRLRRWRFSITQPPAGSDAGDIRPSWSDRSYGAGPARGYRSPMAKLPRPVPPSTDRSSGVGR